MIRFPPSMTSMLALCHPMPEMQVELAVHTEHVSNGTCCPGYSFKSTDGHLVEVLEVQLFEEPNESKWIEMTRNPPNWSMGMTFFYTARTLQHLLILSYTCTIGTSLASHANVCQLSQGLCMTKTPKGRMVCDGPLESSGQENTDISWNCNAILFRRMLRTSKNFQGLPRTSKNQNHPSL